MSTVDCLHPEKYSHVSKRAALKARDSFETTHGIDLTLKPYRCGNHWHLGHRTGRGRYGHLERQLRAARRRETP